MISFAKAIFTSLKEFSISFDISAVLKSASVIFDLTRINKIL